MTGRSPGRAEREALHLQMARMRHLEEALGRLWHEGLITGEMHLGVGEEGIAAGLAAHLQDGDALSLDYRSTPVLVGLGFDLESILLEMLGSPDGLCRGHGGHMHLLSPEHLVHTTGIVGATAPIGLGLALSAQLLRPGCVAVSVFGDGAVNQGMVMESLNLAAVWRLPIVFLCKDNGWAVTTRSSSLTAGGVAARARAFDLHVIEADGRDVVTAWHAAGRAVQRAREGRGPTFLLLECRRPRGHFEDDPVVEVVRHPSQARKILPELLDRARAPEGASRAERAAALRHVSATMGRVAADQWLTRWDPLRRSRHRIGKEAAARLEEQAAREVSTAVDRVLAATGGAP
ncbi:MAG: thiamine pyrophosphate-dependent dehydrogenase E1 component subunit alpha [Brachybacterium paraconglomeratum]|nr:thiamine pyrophosphate-dependent dehydrogenase E1 component subunit alpha [Brachybacterium paraconglomeratum]